MRALLGRPWDLAINLTYKEATWQIYACPTHSHEVVIRWETKCFELLLKI